MTTTQKRARLGKETGQWMFANRGGGIEYVHDPSSGYFRDAPIPKLVRELLQNSLDARDPNASEPVEVNFSETTIPAKAIGAADLSKHVAACRKQIAKEPDTSRHIKVYERASEALQQPTLRCLAVTDTNTTGLTNGKWKALVEQEGAVCKPRIGSPGGSNGIGKNAVFNLSDVRTVFYSTRFLGPKGRVTRMQGKATLMAHRIRSQDRQHIGFYQTQDGPLTGRSIPGCFALERTGTGVFILGFNPRSNDWVAEVAGATVENFFYAIENNQLVVNVCGLDGAALEVTHDSIGMLLDRADGKRSDAAYYWQAIRTATPVETECLDRVGALQVFPDITGGPRRVAYINRKGMLITGSGEIKDNPFSPRGKSLWPDYAVVVVPTTDAGDSWVREMENPSHDSISPDQFPDEPEQKRAKRVLKSSRDAIRTVIDETAATHTYGDTSNLSELAAQIPELDPTADGNRSLTVSTIPTPPAGHVPPSGPDAETPRPEPGPDPDPEPEPMPGPDPNDPTPIPRRPKGRKGKLRFKSPRVIAGSDVETVLAFTPVNDEEGTIQFSILPAGSERDTNKRIAVIKAVQLMPPDEDGKTVELPVKDGQVVLQSTPDTRFCIRVRTEQPLQNMALTLG